MIISSEDGRRPYDRLLVSVRTVCSLRSESTSVGGIGGCGSTASDISAARAVVPSKACGMGLQAGLPLEQRLDIRRAQAMVARTVEHGQPAPVAAAPTT